MTVDLSGMTFAVVRHVDAAPDRLFDLLSDVERMAGLGEEHVEARWTGVERGVGARFEGVNRIGERTWTVPCTVTEHERPGRFGWLVGDPASPSSRWGYLLEPDGDGTRVTQTFAHGPGSSFVRYQVEQQPERQRDVVAGRSAQLQARMGQVLEAAAALLR